MLKFFRQIRQRLILENGLSKYFVYALGEIFLVVIGILLALQINNWNEARKLKKQEVHYLNRLLNENRQDLLTFEKSITDLEKGNLTIVKLSEALKNKDSPDSLLVAAARDYLDFGCHYPFFNPSSSTFEDLSSTGNLGVINDVGLRDLIVGHYAEYQSIASNFEINSGWALPIDAPIYVDYDILKFEKTASFLFDELTLSELAAELRNTKDVYIRNAAVHYWINTDCLALLHGIKKKTIDIVNRLEQESGR